MSTEIPAHRAVLVTGPNGAGKTTLLRVLATSLRPTRGKLELFGMPLVGNLDTIRRRIGLATHQNHLYSDLSAEENLLLVARFSSDVDRRRIPEVLEQIGLSDRAKSATGTFSAGMKRRLCLGRIILRRPQLVLLDEPFSQLDPEGVELVENVIRDLKRRDVTLVMATHDVERGLALCDLHLKLEAGHQIGTIEEIRTAADSKANG
ncbi:MAG: ABC transporter ATP-binding protein [Myxococcota bacterium]